MEYLLYFIPLIPNKVKVGKLELCDMKLTTLNVNSDK